MFRLLFVLAVSLLTFSQCKTTKKPEEKTIEKTTTQPKQAMTTTTEKPTEPQTNYKRPEGKKYIKGGKNQPSNSVYEFFTTDYWLPQFAISSLSKEAHVPYQGMWLKFDRTGHLVGGINKEQNIAGSWTYDAQKNLLFILSNNKDIEGKWSLNRSGFSMVWLAREGQKLQDIQIKLVNSSFKPGEE